MSFVGSKEEDHESMNQSLLLNSYCAYTVLFVCLILRMARMLQQQIQLLGFNP